MSRLDQVDQRLSESLHQSFIRSGDPIIETETSRALRQIATRISRTSYFAGYIFPTQVFYVQNSDGNAFSVGAGRVYIYTGLVDTVKSSEGVLAFSIGHEMAHNRLQHTARKYIRQLEYNATYQRLRYKDQRAALAYQVAWWITEKKIEREEEHAADQLGLFAAAEAGYHPDYGILAARVLRLHDPDKSKLATFLYLNHPRWVTREEHTERNYEAAVALFERKWPNIDSSPGGVPPMLALLTPVRIRKSRSGVRTSTEVEVRNLRGQPALLTAELSQEGQPRRTIFTREFAANQTYPDAISFDIPKSQAATLKKASLLVQVRVGSEILYGSGQISLASSHKVSGTTKSAASSTSQAAESVLAEARMGPANPSSESEAVQALVPTGQEDTMAATKTPNETDQRPHIQAAEVPVKTAESSPAIGVPQRMSISREFSFQETSDGELEVDSYPVGAAVDFNGTPVGITPFKLRFASTGLGFTIHVTKDGYSPWFVQTFASPGRQKFEAHLYPKTAAK